MIRYRFQYDGRLQRSMETGQQKISISSVQIGHILTLSILAVMLMETFDRLSRKEKYVWDVSKFLVSRVILG
jgi:hypothetical protein